MLGTTCRIAPQKKLEELLDALRLALPRMPACGCVLKIAGGVEARADDYAAEMRARSADLPVEWLGEMADVRPLLRELDVFVMISEPAGCPNASLEAMAAALPVIATDFGGASEQVRQPRVFVSQPHAYRH